MKKLSIIIPAYNEGRTIHLILDKIKQVSLLNEIEKEALEHAISSELFSQEGWREERLGRVDTISDSNKGSRTIYKAGYMIAIRRILKEN